MTSILTQSRAVPNTSNLWSRERFRILISALLPEYLFLSEWEIFYHFSSPPFFGEVKICDFRVSPLSWLVNLCQRYWDASIKHIWVAVLFDGMLINTRPFTWMMEQLLRSYAWCHLSSILQAFYLRSGCSKQSACSRYWLQKFQSRSACCTAVSEFTARSLSPLFV